MNEANLQRRIEDNEPLKESYSGGDAEHKSATTRETRR